MSREVSKTLPILAQSLDPRRNFSCFGVKPLFYHDSVVSSVSGKTLDSFKKIEVKSSRHTEVIFLTGLLSLGFKLSFNQINSYW